MDLKRAFNRTQTKAGINKVVHYVGDNPQRFKVLVDIYLAGPFRIAQRAARPMTDCTEAHPKLIHPHLKALLDQLKTPGLHATWKRNTIRLLQFIEVPKLYHARVINICFRYFEDENEALAVRIFSMTVLCRVSLHIPELKQDMTFRLEEQLPYYTKGFLARARMMLKELKAAPK